MLAALQLAGLKPGDVDLIEANASGFAADEAVELDAIAAAFNSFGTSANAKKTYLGSAKGVFGCAEGAAGGVSLAKSLDCILTNSRYPEKQPGKRIRHCPLWRNPTLFSAMQGTPRMPASTWCSSTATARAEPTRQ